MKKNLFLITVKQYNGNEQFHVEGDDISNALHRANDYLNQTKTPGVGFEIISCELVGKIATPDYSLTV